MRSTLAAIAAGRRLILETRSTREDSGAVRTADDDVHAPLLGERHHALQGLFVVQKGVASGEQAPVGVRPGEPEHQLYRFGAVDTEAPSRDHALISQPGERAERTGSSDLELR